MQIPRCSLTCPQGPGEPQMKGSEMNKTRKYVEEGVRVFLEQANMNELEVSLGDTVIRESVIDGVMDQWQRVASGLIGYAENELDFHRLAYLVAIQVADYRVNNTIEVQETEKLVHQLACLDYADNPENGLPDHNDLYPVAQAAMEEARKYTHKIIYDSGVMYRKVSIWDENGKKVTA